MDRKLFLITLAIYLAVLASEIEAQADNNPTSPLLRRRYHRSEMPEAVRRRLSTVTSEEQLLKDLGDIMYYGRTAVIRFYADWCPVCQSDRPRFLDLVDKFPNVNFFRVNVDEHPKLTSEYGIRAVPTYFVLRRNQSHLTYHSAGNVANYLSQLKQARQLRHQQYHQQQQRSRRGS